MNKERISYEILEDGYMLYLDGQPWIKQHTEHVFYPELSLKENAEKHIEDICTPVEPEPTRDEEVARLQAQVAELQAQVEALVNAN